MKARIAQANLTHGVSLDEVTTVSQDLRSRGHAVLRVSGKSMMPWMRPGDIVLVRSVAPDAINKGDILLLRCGTRLCLHRAIQVIPAEDGGPECCMIITKGDAVESADDTVCASDVLGTAHFLYRREKEIGLNSAWRKGFDKLLAAVSPLSRHWYPIICRLKHTFLPGNSISHDSVPVSHPNPSGR